MTTHPLTKGTRVNVRNFTIGGKEIIEGEAKIVQPCNSPDSYMVKFNGERKQFRRFVLPEHAI